MIERDDPRWGEAGGGPVRLSPAGEARREAMLAHLRARVDGRRRGRRAARWAAAVGGPAVLAIAIFASRGAPDRSGPPLAPPAGARDLATPAPRPAARGDGESRLEVIHDDPGVLSRCALPATPLSRSMLMEDQELLDQLQALGRPSGLVRMAGNVYLTSSTGSPEAQAGRDAERG